MIEGIKKFGVGSISEGLVQEPDLSYLVLEPESKYIYAPTSVLSMPSWAPPGTENYRGLI